MFAVLTNIVLLFGLLTVSGALAQSVEIKIVYDNTAVSARFQDDWGFSAVVDVGDERILFDAGADSGIFLRHLDELNIDPGSLTHALISHYHSDHVKGLYRLALRNPSLAVSFLDSFPDEAFEIAMAVGINPRRVSGPAEIAPGVFTTGPLDSKPPEQALIVETAEGPVVLIGGGHPGVGTIVEAVREQRGVDRIRLLVGGFHMMRESEEKIAAEMARLRELNVEQVAPAHSAGEKAKRLFRQAWGRDYIACGAGRTIKLK